MRLYDINASIRAMFDKLGDEEEIPDEMFSLIDGLQAEADHKIDAIVTIIKETQADSNALESEIKRLRARQDVRDNRMDRLKQYLMACLRAAGERKHDTGRHTVRLQNNPERLECRVPTEELADEFTRHTIEPDKTAAMKWYKENGEIPFGFSVVQDEHLRIV